MQHISSAGAPARLGVLGGSFDPIHCAHIELAEQAKKQFALDEVLLLPSGDPPHKTPSVSKEQRYEMVQLAAQGKEGLTPSRIELERTGTIYTVDTLHQLKAALPETELFYIIGADTLFELPTWRNPTEVYSLTTFLVFVRPGSEITDEAMDRAFGSGPRPKVLVGTIRPTDIASSDIRSRIAQGLSVTHMVPPAVRSYIEAHGLYQHCALTFDEAKDRLHEALAHKPKRYAHTLGVVETAEKLAFRYGEDPAKTRWAALLHDCAKGLSTEELFAQCEQYGVEVDEIMQREPGLIHGLLGAVLARVQYGMNDPDVLAAIACHTTGKREMTLLDKIVYLADAIEPGREYPGVDEIRRTSMENLDQALLDSMGSTMRFVLERGGLLHPLTVDARNALIIQLQQEQAL